MGSFESSWGILIGGFGVITLFEDEVFHKNLQLPGTYLEECPCAPQYTFLHLFFTCPPAIELSHSPKLSGIHPQTWACMVPLANTALVHPETLPCDTRHLHLVYCDYTTESWSSGVMCWCLRSTCCPPSNKHWKEVAFTTLQQAWGPVLWGYF